MESVPIKINETGIWLIHEKLVFYEKRKLKESDTFLCYFSFSLPINIPYGELILDENRVPKLFTDKAEAELFAIDYLKNRFHL